ncbi:MAG: esterase/lipase family protein [Rubrobacteraceae bacterium]
MYTQAMANGPIVVVGGVTAWPRNYGGLSGILQGLSGSKVHVVPLTPLDWITGYFRGFGQLVFEIATTVDQALLDSESDRVVLVGHSAGGIACRVYIGGNPPYGGRRYSGHRRVSHLITLGSPHAVTGGKRLSPINRVNELFPGALHAEAGLGYRSVAGNAEDGSSSRKTRKRYARFVEDGAVAGDGAIPVEAALLPGSEHLVLDGVYHNKHLGNWYGSDQKTIEQWWPQALRKAGRVVEGHHA